MRLRSLAYRSLDRGRRGANAAALRALAPRSYDLHNTIVVTGTPRSGTTWAGQVISSLPSSAVLFEPLHLDRVPRAREAGFSWRTYVRPGAEWPDGAAFLEAVLRGGVLNVWTTREISWPKTVRTWIVKCVRLNRLLPWLTERFPVRPPLMVIRHPCAVVASQISAGLDLPTSDVSEALLADFPQASDVLDSIETDEEHRAAGWALDTLVPLSQPRPHRWIALSYEHLLRGEDAFDAVFARWGIPRPGRLGKVMRARSSTAPSRSSGLTGWRQKLTPDQVRRILAVTTAFGLDFYGEDPEPDDERISRWGVDVTGVR